MNQPTLFDIPEAERLKEQGIQMAVDHANSVEPGWSEKAYQLLNEFLLINTGEFMAEDVRSYAAVIDFEIPPSSRAWGGVIQRAAKSGIIKQVGFGKTKNVKAHRTPAAIWKRS